MTADRDLLLTAVKNLLQNAFKFTRPGTEVTLLAYELDGDVLIEVADHCGGLPNGAIETMFEPFTQHGDDLSGLGLGLSIAKRSINACKGQLNVQDIVGIGCRFTVRIPKDVQRSASSTDALIKPFKSI